MPDNTQSDHEAENHYDFLTDLLTYIEKLAHT